MTADTTVPQMQYRIDCGDTAQRFIIRSHEQFAALRKRISMPIYWNNGLTSTCLNTAADLDLAIDFAKLEAQKTGGNPCIRLAVEKEKEKPVAAPEQAKSVLERALELEQIAAAAAHPKQEFERLLRAANRACRWEDRDEILKEVKKKLEDMGAGDWRKKGEEREKIDNRALAAIEVITRLVNKEEYELLFACADGRSLWETARKVLNRIIPSTRQPIVKSLNQ